METFRITYEELIPYFVAANVILGFLFGSFPLIAGLIMKNRKYAMFGFAGSIIGGGLLGPFLSYPIAAIFLWLILRNPPVQIVSEEKIQVSETATGSDSI